MSRCWGCCQENCGYRNCSCSCHESSERAKQKVQDVAARPPVLPVGTSTADILPMPAMCQFCDAIGAHFCKGQQGTRVGSAEDGLRGWIDESNRRKELERAKSGSTQCPDHKRYQAKRKPRTNCEACWRIWIALNPG